MRSPEEQPQQTIEEYLYEAISGIEMLNADREDKKALLREKCTEIGKTLGLMEGQGKILAQYYFKLLDSDPERAGKFWEMLKNLHYNATNPEATVHYLSILSGLVDESGLTYLWNLAHGIIKGDYEVLPGDVAKKRCYFLLYRDKADAKKQNKNPKRHASLKAARELVDGMVVQKPLVGLRTQDLIGFSDYESDVFRGICKTLDKHIDILLYAKEETDDIFIYFELVKTKLASVIDELGVSDKVKTKYKLFIDTVVHKFLTELFDYASEMNKKENENEFVRDIINETFAIVNGTIDANNKGVSPIEKLKEDWDTLKTNLTAFHQNPANASIQPSHQNQALGQTMFFVGDKTPIEGEPIPQKPGRSNTPSKGGTDHHIPSIQDPLPKPRRAPQPAVKVVAPKMVGTPQTPPTAPQPAPTPQAVTADVNDLLQQTRIGMSALTDTATTEPRNAPLTADLAGNTISTENVTLAAPEETMLPPIAPLELIREMIPSYKNFGKMRELVANNGMIPRLYNNEKELNALLDDVQNSVIYSKIEAVLQRAPEPLYIIQQNAEELRTRLDKMKKRRTEFTGGWFSRSFRNIGAKGRAANQNIEEYFDQIDLVIEELWDKEIMPTLQKLTAKYVNQRA